MDKIVVESLSFFYGEKRALTDISISVPERQITALIGSSGCGKSTFLRCLNRMNDTIRGARVEGQVLLDGDDIYAPGMDVVELRARVGMVFQRPNPFPQTVFDNVAFGPRVQGFVPSRGHVPSSPVGDLRRGSASGRNGHLEELVEQSLRDVHLWDEVKSNPKQDALSLSLGQQQRLCIARVIAVHPEVILMDEPCSALDPIATLKVEDLMRELSANYTIVIVTHNMQQAARASDYTAFFNIGPDHAGHLVEFGSTHDVFTHPKEKQTEDYITGRFG